MTLEAPRLASAAQMARAVFWSFFGVRSSADYASDSATIRPLQVVMAGIIGAALFVLTLVAVVKLVTS